ncbi:MAG TPA: SRPBCC family protein [Candidatus Acidoferrales bacterium]|nr:SRPBCC family protein [Candidatus Acidoferrales bacterium]
MRGKPGPVSQIHANVPTEWAYAYVADLTRHPEWSPEAMMIAPESDGPVGVGSRFSAEGGLFSRRGRSKVTITALEPPAQIEFEVEGATTITGHVFTFSSYGGGTTITRQPFGIKQPLLSPVTGLVSRGAMNKNVVGALAKLRANLELGMQSARRPDLPVG